VIETFERALEATTRSLQGDVGSVFNERRLERTLVEHLKAGDGWSAAHAQHSIRLEDFPGVGPVDIALEDDRGAPIALVELKWGPNLHACAWDMAKLALCASSDGIPGLLVAAAREEEWVNPGHELFDARSWRLDTLLTRFGSWFAYWANDVQCRPKRLPATWRTRDRMTIPFDLEGEPWELRAILIDTHPAPLLKVSYEPVALGAERHFRDLGSPLQPVQLDVSGGPRLDPAYRIQWNGEGLVLTRRNWHGDTTGVESQPSDSQWAAFVKRLDEIDVWSWQSPYEPEEDVRDGYEWSAAIEIRGRRLESRGYMAYPGGGGSSGRETWDAFLLALESLVGERLN